MMMVMMGGGGGVCATNFDDFHLVFRSLLCVVLIYLQKYGALCRINPDYLNSLGVT